MEETWGYDYLPDMGNGCTMTIPSRPKSKWLKMVFKIKHNGVYRACLVAKGFSQIPGVHFTQNFSPVVTAITFHVVLVCMLIENLDAIVIDVEAAFLYGKLDEELYMQIPPGYKEVFMNEDLNSIDSSYSNKHFMQLCR